MVTRPRSAVPTASPEARGYFPKGAAAKPRESSGPAAPANIGATSTGTVGWPGGHGHARSPPPIGGPLGPAPGPPGGTGSKEPRRGPEDRGQTSLPGRQVPSCRSWVLSSRSGLGQSCERDFAYDVMSGFGCDRRAMAGPTMSAETNPVATPIARTRRDNSSWRRLST